MNSSFKEQIPAKCTPKGLMFCNLKLKTSNLKLAEGAEFLTKAVHPGPTRNSELGTRNPVLQPLLNIDPELVCLNNRPITHRHLT